MAERLSSNSTPLNRGFAIKDKECTYPEYSEHVVSCNAIYYCFHSLTLIEDKDLKHEFCENFAS